MCEERNGRIDLNELISLIDRRTRLVAISHVQYASGFAPTSNESDEQLERMMLFLLWT